MLFVSEATGRGKRVDRVKKEDEVTLRPAILFLAQLDRLRILGWVEAERVARHRR